MTYLVFEICVKLFTRWIRVRFKFHSFAVLAKRAREQPAPGSCNFFEPRSEIKPKSQPVLTVHYFRLSWKYLIYKVAAIAINMTDEYFLAQIFAWGNATKVLLDNNK